MGYDKFNHTVNRVIEHGNLTILALIAKDGAGDDGVAMGSGGEESCSEETEVELGERIHGGERIRGWANWK